MKPMIAAVILLATQCVFGQGSSTRNSGFGRCNQNWSSKWDTIMNAESQNRMRQTFDQAAASCPQTLAMTPQQVSQQIQLIQSSGVAGYGTQSWTSAQWTTYEQGWVEVCKCRQSSQEAFQGHQARQATEQQGIQALGNILSIVFASSPTEPIASQTGLASYEDQQRYQSVLGDNASSSIPLDASATAVMSSSLDSADASGGVESQLESAVEQEVNGPSPNPGPSPAPLPPPEMPQPSSTPAVASTLEDPGTSTQNSTLPCLPPMPMTITPPLAPPPALPAGYAPNSWSAMCRSNGDDQIGQPPQIMAAQESTGKKDAKESSYWDLFGDPYPLGPKQFDPATGKWKTITGEEFKGGGVEDFNEGIVP